MSSTTAHRPRSWRLGFRAEDVRKVVRLIKISEYKRRQAAVGIRITPRGFGKDWRYPITSAWNEWESVGVRRMRGRETRGQLPSVRVSFPRQRAVLGIGL